MEYRIDTITQNDGELQRFLVVTGFNWKELGVTKAATSPESLRQLGLLYKVGIIPKDPSQVGKLVFFHVPDSLAFPLPRKVGDTLYYDCTSALAAGFEAGESWANELLKTLEEKGWATSESGTGKGVRPMPVGGGFGYESSLASGYALTSNAHFFVMDTLDGLSPYDLFGAAYGFTVADGKVLLPPVHHRPALAVDEKGHVSIIHPELHDLVVRIDGIDYIDGRNCRFFQRPDTETTPKGEGTDILLSDGRVMAVRNGGGSPVPMGGFVIHTGAIVSIADPHVTFTYKEHYRFAIQVGPAMVDEGRAARGFEGCPFCILGKTVPFPPTIYPLDWEKGRAGRIVLGSGKDDKPCLIWAEAAGVLGHVKGKESAGVSLAEMAAYCSRIGLWNAVNLDGGGSSQILLGGRRLLKLKDRTPHNEEAERPVPGMLCVR